MGEEEDPGTSVLNQGQRAGQEGLAGQSNRAEPPRDPALPRPAPRGVWWEEEAQVTSSPGGPATRSLVAQEPAVLPRTTTPAPPVSAPPRPPCILLPCMVCTPARVRPPWLAAAS